MGFEGVAVLGAIWNHADIESVLGELSNLVKTR